MNPADIQGLIQMISGVQTLAGVISLDIDELIPFGLDRPILVANAHLLEDALTDVRETMEEMISGDSRVFEFLTPSDN